MRGEFLQDRVVEIVKSVEADAEDDDERRAEYPGQEVTVDDVRGLLSLPGAYLAQGGALSFLHQLLHVRQFLAQLVHRLCDILDRVATGYI